MQENNSQQGSGSSALTWLGLVFSLACLYWLYKSVDMVELKNTLLSADWRYLVLCISMMAVSYVVRAERWKYFFPTDIKVDLWPSLRCLVIGFFMNNILPARMGEVARSIYGGKAFKTSRMTVLATVAGERLADAMVISGLFVLLFSILGLGLGFGPARPFYFVAIGFFAVGVVTWIYVFLREKLESRVSRLVVKINLRLVEKIWKKLQKFTIGLVPMTELTRLSPILFYSLIIWGIELSVYIVVSKAFGLELSWGMASLYLACANFSSLIPSSPGGIGVIEAITAGVVSQTGVSKELALAVIATQHLMQILVVGIPGVIFVLKSRGYTDPLASSISVVNS